MRISNFQSLKFKVWTLEPYWRPKAQAGPAGPQGAQRALSPLEELEGRVPSGLTSYFAPNSSNFAPKFQVTFFANMSSKMVRILGNYFRYLWQFSGMYFFPISHLFLILMTWNDKQRRPHLCCHLQQFSHLVKFIYNLSYQSKEADLKIVNTNEGRFHGSPG